MTEECSIAIALDGRFIGTTSASSPISVPGPAIISAPAPSSTRKAPRWTTKPASASSPRLNRTSPRTKSRCSEPIASMRNDASPNRRSVGTRSSSATSSSIDIQIRGSRARDLKRFARPSSVSRHQLVAPGFRHQDFRVGGVLLDLLAEAVDVGFQRVGGDAGIIAPDLLEQGLARNRHLAGTVEETQDRRLLLRQPHLAGVGGRQHLGAGTEAVGADREHRVLAGLVLAEVGADAGGEHGKA